MTTNSGGVTEPTSALPVAEDGGQPQVVYVREPRRGGRRFLIFLGTVGILIAAYFGLQSLNLLPGIPNPFAKETTDRTGPVLLTSMQNLSHYVAAEGNFQVLVDLQENNSFIPDFIFNKRTLFVGVGSVDAYVDFGKLTDGNIKISPDGKAVEIILPDPVLEKPSLDPGKSYTFAEERGAINRIGDLFNGDPNKQQQLYQLAEQKIADAAKGSGLVDRARTNTESMLVSLLTQLGFERVTVTFQPPAAP